MTLAVGIDLGGTAIKGGLVTSEGEMVHRTSILTRADEGPDAVIGRIADLATSLMEHATRRHERPTGVGVGAPGTVRGEDGVIVCSPNLAGWRNIPLAASLRQRLECRVVLNNDANSAALGEFVRGAGRDVSDMVMLTLGTGVGGGVIVDRRLYVGSSGNAGELGHTLVRPGGRRCGCGQLGCLEAYASATSTVQRAMEAIRAGERSSLSAMIAEARDITAAEVVVAAQLGDGLARRVWEETCRCLAIACINFQMSFDPGCIVLAGGMSVAGEALTAPIRRFISEMMSPTFTHPPDIRLAKLGNDAGFVGAALSVFDGQWGRTIS